MARWHPAGPAAGGPDRRSFSLGVARLLRNRVQRVHGEQEIAGLAQLAEPPAVDLHDLADLLSAEVLEAGQLRRRLDEKAAAVDEGHVAEIDLLLSRERVGRRAALEVDGAADDRRDPRVDGDRYPLHVELLELELLLH